MRYESISALFAYYDLVLDPDRNDRFYKLLMERRLRWHTENFVFQTIIVVEKNEFLLKRLTYAEDFFGLVCKGESWGQ